MLPFIIQRFVFQPEGQAQIANLDDPKGTPGTIPGYFVMSSAPPNIDPNPDEKPEFTEAQQQQYAQQGVNEIADHLRRMIAASPESNAELVITVHGYNTSRGGVQAWYKNIFKYVNRHDETIAAHPNRVFVGYRWPSENVKLSRFLEAILALPPLPRDILFTGVVGLFLFVLFQFITLGATWWGRLLSVAFGLATALGLLMFALVVLRLVVYFRDNYRANNFGVLDLVELLRQIDHAIVQRTAEEMFPGMARSSTVDQAKAMAQAQNYWSRRAQNNKIKLSFIGHSMGAFVVTNVVRILSDVFDDSSVKKRPDSNVGDVFRLERLVLASPDIPVLTIITSRANFLASSLRRFSESYLFSSEGDIALRIASTAANYIAFPSRTQARGYRLGNVALRNPSVTPVTYGLINLPHLDQDFPPNVSVGAAISQAQDKVMEALFLTFQRFQIHGVVTLASLFQEQSPGNSNQATIADLFTYFDCTDYVDFRYDPEDNTCSAQPMGLLTQAKGKPVLKSWDYFLLTLDYATGKRDVHGGYFQGQFTQKLLYGLAFLGFGGYLNTLNTDPQVALSQLHVDCQAKGIQGYLSPFRYRVDIQGGNLEGSLKDMLRAIEDNAAQTMTRPSEIPTPDQ
ncbi:alpha/beta hydrolase [Phormidium sp. FACHB-1136]|nr:alpha/beta hydrolase [Phormidium sp. FACHB-1136]